MAANRYVVTAQNFLMTTMADQSDFSVYRKWLKGADWLELPVLWLGQLSAWLMLPLVGVILFDAVC